MKLVPSIIVVLSLFAFPGVAMDRKCGIQLRIYTEGDVMQRRTATEIADAQERRVRVLQGLTAEYPRLFSDGHSPAQAEYLHIELKKVREERKRLERAQENLRKRYDEALGALDRAKYRHNEFMVVDAEGNLNTPLAASRAPRFEDTVKTLGSALVSSEMKLNAQLELEAQIVTRIRQAEGAIDVTPLPPSPDNSIPILRTKAEYIALRSQKESQQRALMATPLRDMTTEQSEEFRRLTGDIREIDLVLESFDVYEQADSMH